MALVAAVPVTARPAALTPQAPDIHEHMRTLEMPDGSQMVVIALIDHSRGDPVAAMDRLLPGSSEPERGGATAAFATYGKWRNVTVSAPVAVKYYPASEPPGVDGAFATQYGIDAWNVILGHSFRFGYRGLANSLGGQCSGDPAQFDTIVTVSWSSDFTDPTIADTCYRIYRLANGTEFLGEADVRLRTNIDWSTAIPTPSGRFDLISTVIHELGHVMGLSHTDVAGSIMTTTAMRGEQLRPGPDDILGVRSLYGNNEPIPPPIDRTNLPKKVAILLMSRE